MNSCGSVDKRSGADKPQGGREAGEQWRGGARGRDGEGEKRKRWREKREVGRKEEGGTRGRGGGAEQEGGRQEGRGEGYLEGLVHEPLLLGQGLPVLLHLLHAASHLHACIFFIQASLPQLTYLPHRRRHR